MRASHSHRWYAAFSILIGSAGSINTYSQQLVWEKPVDTLRYDYFSREPTISIQYQSSYISVGNGAEVLGAEIATGNVAIKIPRRNIDSATSSTCYVTQKWVDGDDGWEVLGYGYVTKPTPKYRFILYDESGVLLQGDGLPSLGFDGTATFLVAQHLGYKVYKLRDGLKPAAAQVLPKSAAGKQQGMVFFGHGSPGFQFDDKRFNPSGVFQR